MAGPVVRSPNHSYRVIVYLQKEGKECCGTHHAKIEASIEGTWKDTGCQNAGVTPVDAIVNVIRTWEEYCKSTPA